MLQITKKKYEIEEPISLLGDNGEELFRFDMQLTADEVDELKKAILNKDMINMSNKIKSLGKQEKEEESEKSIDEILEMGDKLNTYVEEVIGRLCFKDNKDKFIEIGGKAKYEEMLGVISDFLLDFFMKKQIVRTNTINSDLAKVMKN